MIGSAFGFLDNGVAIVLGAFLAAWALSRASGAVAARVLTWHDMRH